jgi:predicted nucleic acid-binding protein
MLVQAIQFGVTQVVDALIAASVLNRNETLSTANARDFRSIKDLPLRLFRAGSS